MLITLVKLLINSYLANMFEERDTYIITFDYSILDFKIYFYLDIVALCDY